MMGKGPRQGAPAPSGVAGGVCSWSAVSMEPAVRDKIRKLLDNLVHCVDLFWLPEVVLLEDTDQALVCDLSVLPYTRWN